MGMNSTARHAHRTGVDGSKSPAIPPAPNDMRHCGPERGLVDRLPKALGARTHALRLCDAALPPVGDAIETEWYSDTDYET